MDNNGHTISDQNDRLRSGKICKELTLKYGLHMASGKENVKRERLREPDATKYRIYDALVKHVPQSQSWADLQKRLHYEGIEIGFKTKGSTSQVEGVRFTMNNLTFNGSKVDKMFSFSKIEYVLRQNQRVEQLQQQSSIKHDFNLISTVGFSDLLDNPDVLTCLANLSNEEVFTPPVVVNQMLDLLPVELWRNPDLFLMIFCCVIIT